MSDQYYFPPSEKNNMHSHKEPPGHSAETGLSLESSLLPGVTAETVASLEEWCRLCLTCSRCSLRKGASGVVFGEGNPRAHILFVGEGPGGEEDKLGRPFVGAAGQLLDRILAAAALAREDVYIANVVKCRPPGNRQPKQDEIATCLPLLQRQINLIDPAIIVCMGAVASRTLIRSDFSITRERGHWHELEDRMLMPTFHPAALLRDPRKKKAVWEDMQQVIKLYGQIYREES